MSTNRAKIPKDKSQSFFTSIKIASNLTWDQLANTIGISGRTLRNWTSSRYLANLTILESLSKKYNIPLPSGLDIRPQFWNTIKSSRMGGIARVKLHGPPGTKEGRSNGGKNSQINRLLYPNKYRALGCKVRKEIKTPPHSIQLSEFCGILLGDGGLTHRQINITLNKSADAEYVEIVENLIKDLFNEPPTKQTRDNVVIISLSGINYVDYCKSLGLHIGNKVKQQVDIPNWIKSNIDFSRSCVRGLFDTDGCVYTHIHSVKGATYHNLGVTLTNHSLPIIKSAHEILHREGIKSYIQDKTKLYIYQLKSIHTFFQRIYSSNPKHVDVYNTYLKNKLK